MQKQNIIIKQPQGILCAGDFIELRIICSVGQIDMSIIWLLYAIDSGPGRHSRSRTRRMKSGADSRDRCASLYAIAIATILSTISNLYNLLPTNDTDHAKDSCCNGNQFERNRDASDSYTRNNHSEWALHFSNEFFMWPFVRSAPRPWAASCEVRAAEFVFFLLLVTNHREINAGIYFSEKNLLTCTVRSVTTAPMHTHI